MALWTAALERVDPSWLTRAQLPGRSGSQMDHMGQLGLAGPWVAAVHKWMLEGRTLPVKCELLAQTGAALATGPVRATNYVDHHGV